MRTTPEHAPAGGSSKQAGQGLVEFAFVAPILILLIAAIFQFAWVLQAQMGLTNAVREAARRAAAASGSVSDSGSLGTWTVNELDGSGGLLAQNVQAFTSTRLASGDPTATFSCYTVGTVTSQQITVSATYNYPVFFPLLNFVLPGTDWPLSASAQMRLETNLASISGSGC